MNNYIKFIFGGLLLISTVAMSSANEPVRCQQIVEIITDYDFLPNWNLFNYSYAQVEGEDKKQLLEELKIKFERALLECIGNYRTYLHSDRPMKCELSSVL